MVLLFLKNYRPQAIAHKLSLLYLLNLLDLILGSILFHANVTLATNPLSAYLFTNPWLTFILKIALPAALFIYLFYYLSQTESAKLIRISNLCISVLLVFYSFMNLVHLSHWILFPIIQAIK